MWLYSRPIIIDHFIVGLRAGLVGRDVPPVAEYRALVREFRDLVHAVRDIEEGKSLRAEPLQHRKHLCDVGGR
jgi:hypothetical protein